MPSFAVADRADHGERVLAPAYAVVRPEGLSFDAGALAGPNGAVQDDSHRSSYREHGPAGTRRGAVKGSHAVVVGRPGGGGSGQRAGFVLRGVSASGTVFSSSVTA
uniref:Uncharacterized protein n=1 Tax=Streptomyces avermitilis TaxID=33903 RepID=A0A499V6Z7_STRAX|nr:hypothetical protein SAVMC3_12490 [Streptomyces avermitilis]